MLLLHIKAMSLYRLRTVFACFFLNARSCQFILIMGTINNNNNLDNSIAIKGTREHLVPLSLEICDPEYTVLYYTSPRSNAKLHILVHGTSISRSSGP
jgi:hypothetical protein